MSTALLHPAARQRTLPPALNRLCSFPAFLAALLMLLAVLTVRSRFDDPDVWWHLKTGQVIATTHIIPRTDLFSYTTHQHALVAHEWLAQVLIYGAYHAAGYAGLMLWLCTLTGAVLVGAYALCFVYGGNAKVAFFGALLVWFFGTVGFSVRPQLLGYLFLVVELMLLELGRARNPRWLLALPPLFGVWVMCHGSFVFGLVVALAVFACSWVPVSVRFFATRANPHRWRDWLGGALAVSVVALLLNPAGLGTIVYPWNTLTRQPVNLAQVEEWQPVPLTDSRGLALLAVLGVLLVASVAGKAKLYLDELVILVLAAWGAASHVRLLFPFGILAAPVLCRLLAAGWRNDEHEPDRPMLNACLMALCVWGAIIAFPSKRSLAQQVAASSPVNAVRYMQAHHVRGPMLNAYRYGGYLIWSAPEYPVFIDGRADVYEWAGVLQQFARWAMLQENPRFLLNRYRVNVCLVQRASPMTQVLALLPEWQLVYSDEQAAVFTRRSSSQVR